MANTQETTSRRRFFHWIGAVAAGTSLAGIGLSTIVPTSALAADKKASAPANCTICEGCWETHYCEQIGQNSYLMAWQTLGGCAPNCHTFYYYKIVTSSYQCYNPCA